MLVYKSRQPLKVRHILRQWLDCPGRITGIKEVGFGIPLIQHGTRAEHGMIWQHTTRKEDASGSNKTILADRHGFGGLPTFVQINAMCEYLRPSAGESRVSPNLNGIGAINVVSSCDGSFCPENQFRSPFDVSNKESAITRWKACYPIEAANRGLLAHFQ